MEGSPCPGQSSLQLGILQAVDGGMLKKLIVFANVTGIFVTDNDFKIYGLW